MNEQKGPATAARNRRAAAIAALAILALSLWYAYRTIEHYRSVEQDYSSVQRVLMDYESPIEANRIRAIRQLMRPPLLAGLRQPAIRLAVGSLLSDPSAKVRSTVGLLIAFNLSSYKVESDEQRLILTSLSKAIVTEEDKTNRFGFAFYLNDYLLTGNPIATSKITDTTLLECLPYWKQAAAGGDDRDTASSASDLVERFAERARLYQLAIAASRQLTVGGPSGPADEIHRGGSDQSSKEVVTIGYFPGKPEIIERVSVALKKTGLQADVEGSKSFGITVSLNMEARGRQLLCKLVLEDRLPIEIPPHPVHGYAK